MPGLEPPAAAAADERPREVAGQRDDPDRGLRRPVERGGDEEEAYRDERAGRKPGDGREEVAIAAARERVQREMSDADYCIGAGEDEGVVAEHVGHGQRRHEHRHHGAEHDEPDLALFGIDGVRQPGVRRPGPPEDAEHDEAFRESRPGGVAADQRRDLREREDEDEVEEQLEGRDALLAVLVARLDGQRPTS